MTFTHCEFGGVLDSITEQVHSNRQIDVIGEEARRHTADFLDHPCSQDGVMTDERRPAMAGEHREKDMEHIDRTRELAVRPTITRFIQRSTAKLNDRHILVGKAAHRTAENRGVDDDRVAVAEKDEVEPAARLFQDVVQRARLSATAVVSAQQHDFTLARGPESIDCFVDVLALLVSR